MMILKVKNLGTIRETTLDVRPLTVIIGPNNTSKTYLAYVVYGLWQKLAGEVALTAGYSAFLARSSKRHDFVHHLIKTFHERSGTFAEQLTEYFQDSRALLFGETVIEAKLDAAFASRAVEGLPKDPDFADLAWTGDKVGSRVQIPEDVEWPLRLRNALASTFPTGLLLPAERNAFVIAYKMLQTRRYRLLRDERFSHRKSPPDHQAKLSREQGDLRYPTPIEDFLDFLVDVETDAPRLAKAPGREPFEALAIQIENGIQQKNKTRFRSTELGGRELSVDVKRGLTIDLYNASSSIKQLAPLLLFLRYRAARGGLLVIDEPEMNLHPEGQAKLLEALAILVRLGVNVLLTTHSPYFLTHLNNLLLGNRNEPEKLEAQSKALYLRDSRAFLSRDEVGAYEMTESGLRSLYEEDHGIRWDTLSDVFGDLQKRYFKLERLGRSSGEEE